MTDLQRIKKKIHDEERINEILEALECNHIRTEQGGDLYVSSLPDGENVRSVQIKNNENLSSNIRSRNVSGDIYNIISYIKYGAETKELQDANLHKSKYWLCQTLNYMEFIDEFYKETSDVVEAEVDYNSWLSKVYKDEYKELPLNVLRNEDEIKKYGSLPSLDWIKEGISYRTQLEFGVGLDMRSERITFPIHNKDGMFIGAKGRYCGRDKEVEDRYKYLYVIPCNKSIEFFNLHRAYPHIMKSKEVIIVEGAKTVMKLWTWGIKNAISIEGDSFSDVQISLLRDLGLGIKYVFAWDKDKKAEYVSNEARRLTGRMKYGILDIENLLSDKDSPVDQGRLVWDKLYEDYSYRIA